MTNNECKDDSYQSKGSLTYSYVHESLDSTPGYFDQRQMFNLAQETNIVRVLGGQIQDAPERIALEGMAYTFCSEVAFYHKRGSGGENFDFTLLREGDKDLLVSRKSHKYDTYSDDSEDHDVGTYYDTYLLAEDQFAREIFEKIKNLHTRKSEGLDILVGGAG